MGFACFRAVQYRARAGEGIKKPGRLAAARVGTVVRKGPYSSPQKCSGLNGSNSIWSGLYSDSSPYSSMSSAISRPL